MGNKGRGCRGVFRPATPGRNRDRNPCAAGTEQRRLGVKRSSLYLSGLLGFGGMLLLAGGSQAQGPGGAPPGGAAPPPAGGQPPAVAASRPTIAVFNMAAVMRDYGKAKYQVYMLNKKRNELSKDLIAW